MLSCYLNLSETLQILKSQNLNVIVYISLQDNYYKEKLRKEVNIIWKYINIIWKGNVNVVIVIYYEQCNRETVILNS